jgi:hypothetical protein
MQPQIMDAATTQQDDRLRRYVHAGLVVYLSPVIGLVFALGLAFCLVMFVAGAVPTKGAR